MKSKIFVNIDTGEFFRIRNKFMDHLNIVPVKDTLRAKMNAPLIQLPIADFESDKKYQFIPRSAKMKPEPKLTRGWGSKNSQVRLDKACRRFGNRLRREGRSFF